MYLTGGHFLAFLKKTGVIALAFTKIHTDDEDDDDTEDDEGTKINMSPPVRVSGRHNHRFLPCAPVNRETFQSSTMTLTLIGQWPNSQWSAVFYSE